MLKYIPLILTGVLLNAFAQILLKKGMLSIGYFGIQFESLLPMVRKVATNFYILLGLGPMWSVSQFGCWCSRAWKSATLALF